MTTDTAPAPSGRPDGSTGRTEALRGCSVPDCKRAACPDWSRCDDHTRLLLERPPVDRARPRVVVRRIGVQPLAVASPRELDELELAWLHGDH